MDAHPRGVILLVDDDVMIRNLVRTTLEADGYSVLVAADGSEAVELSRTHEGTIDLLLTDVEMPQIDGISAYRQIITHQADIKVLFISGGMSGKLEFPQSVPFLSKPLDLAALRTKVHEILTSRKPPVEPKVILIVDHNEDHRNRIKGILTGNGYAVLLANSVEEAEVVSDSIAKIDLIVSEVVFTGRSGIQLAEHVETSDRDISTLLISHFHPELLRNMEGFSRQPEFLSNPFTPEAFLETRPPIIGMIKRMTILIAEDEAIVRNLMIAVLVRAEYSVLEADSAVEALKVSNTFEGVIDLLITDHTLGTMTGRQLAEKIRQERPGLKVLHTSGHQFERLEQEEGILPGALFLAKPFMLKDLIEKVRELLSTDPIALSYTTKRKGLYPKCSGGKGFHDIGTRPEQPEHFGYNLLN